MLVIGWLISPYVYIGSWFMLLVASFVFFMLIVMLVYVFGFDGPQKKVVSNRYQQIKSIV
jgi:hypothetical protein